MTPLMTMILRFMRGGTLAAAGFMVLVIGIEIWKRWRFGGFGSMERHDVTFMAVLVLMLAAFLWLARSISRELRKESRSGGEPEP